MSSTSEHMSMPSFMYGTAWKKERTKDLVVLAVKSGFRGIDTACQPKHYYEPGVGEALQALYDEGVITRDELFIQTKYTSIGGQNPDNVPYNPRDSLEDQVMQSFQVSCKNLNTEYLDSLVMHSPMSSFSDTIKVWKTFEHIYNQGGVRQLGLSNTYDLETLKRVYDQAEIKPSILQNRFYEDTGYDVEIRQFCKEHNIRYQSFWTLTANPHILRSSCIQSLAGKYSKTPQQIFFKFVQSLGITPLTGTSSATHMLQDLDTVNFKLEDSEIDVIEALL